MLKTCLFFVLFRYIRRGKPDDGFSLFGSEPFKSLGFAEFDDVNGKVLTCLAQDKINRINHNIGGNSFVFGLPKKFVDCYVIWASY